MCQGELCWGVAAQQEEFCHSSPPVFKSSTFSPPSTFLPHPPLPPHTLHTSETYFGPSDESQMPPGSSRSGGALQALLRSASLAMPPSCCKPRERGKEGSGEKEDNTVVEEPGPPHRDYS